jgi:subtilisin
LGGFPDGTFRPNANITRGQIAKIVSNAAGFSEDPGNQIYADVPPGSPFYRWINRLTNRGIVAGYPCPQRPGEAMGAEECTPDNASLYRPNMNATRGQMAKIVSNAAYYNEAVSSRHYADVPPTGEGSQFYEWIERLTNRGVMAGYPCGTLDPRSGPCDEQNRPYFRSQNAVTRGQASKIVANTFFPNCQTNDQD